MRVEKTLKKIEAGVSNGGSKIRVNFDRQIIMIGDFQVYIGINLHNDICYEIGINGYAFINVNENKKEYHELGTDEGKGIKDFSKKFEIYTKGG